MYVPDAKYVTVVVESSLIPKFPLKVPNVPILTWTAVIVPVYDTETVIWNPAVL